MIGTSAAYRRLSSAITIRFICSRGSAAFLSDYDSLGTRAAFLQLASRARTSHSPGEARDSTATAPVSSGRRLPRLTWFDHQSFSWRTWQRCFIEGWTLFSDRWPRSGTTRRGIAYKLPTLARRTSGTGSGSAAYWATPSVNELGIDPARIVDKHGNPPTHPNQRLYDKHTGRLVQDGLPQQVLMFPTPQARDWKSGSTKTDYGNSRPLSEHVKFPTPTAGDAKSSGSGNNPDSAAHTGTSLTDFVRPDRPNLDGSRQREVVTGQLNPEFVEWLIGLPLGWTMI
jgi:hypothetical protein